MMKTNQKMVVDFRYGTLEIGHLDYMGNLTELFIIGNRYRYDDLKADPVYLKNWLKLDRTIAYIKEVEAYIGRPAITTTRGRTGTTYAHLFILLLAAQDLSPKFQLEIHKTFIRDKLLQYRDDGGDSYIDLSNQIAQSAEAVLGKPAHNGHYITIANIMRKRILPDEHPGWNYATPEDLRKRLKIEDKLIGYLQDGQVRDWDHLKELAEKVRI